HHLPTSSPPWAALMSQPAENTRSPAAVTMPTLRSGSSRSRTNAAPKRRLVTMSMALTLGRSIVTSNTCPRCSTLTDPLIPLLLLPRRRLGNTPGMGRESSDRPALAAPRQGLLPHAVGEDGWGASPQTARPAIVPRPPPRLPHCVGEEWVPV